MRFILTCATGSFCGICTSIIDSFDFVSLFLPSCIIFFNNHSSYFRFYCIRLYVLQFFGYNIASIISWMLFATILISDFLHFWHILVICLPTHLTNLSSFAQFFWVCGSAIFPLGYQFWSHHELNFLLYIQRCVLFMNTFYSFRFLRGNINISSGVFLFHDSLFSALVVLYLFISSNLWNFLCCTGDVDCLPWLELNGAFYFRKYNS